MMKKVMLAAAGMLASSVSVMAVNSDVAATVADETYSSDHFTSLYFSAGCGFDWMKNKGDGNEKDKVSGNNLGTFTIKKQSPSSFIGVFGLGYQRVFAQRFLAGIEFDCTVGQKKDNDLYLLIQNQVNGPYQGSSIKNKSIGLGLFAKFGYVFCGKHLVYTKLGVAWPGSKVTLYDSIANKVSRYDIDKGVFAAALGYQYKFSNRFSGFGEVTYTSRQKKDFDWDHNYYVAPNNTSLAASKWSVKAHESWGVKVGVACHLFTK